MNTKITKFVDYFCSWYLPGEPASSFFNDELTREMVEKHVEKYSKFVKNFGGDTFDRLLYKDILMVEYGYQTLDKCEFHGTDRWFGQ